MPLPTNEGLVHCLFVFIVMAFRLHGKHNFKGVFVDVICVDIRLNPCVGWVVCHNFLLRPRLFKEEVGTVKFRNDGIIVMQEELSGDILCLATRKVV